MRKLIAYSIVGIAGSFVIGIGSGSLTVELVVGVAGGMI
jgi:hypothetical protein